MYTAELQAVAEALICAKENNPPNSRVLVVTVNLSVLQVLNKPDKQSGQCLIQSIYNILKELERRYVKVTWMWISATIQCITRDRAKEGCRTVTGTQGTCSHMGSEVCWIGVLREQTIYMRDSRQPVGSSIGSSVKETAYPCGRNY